MKREILFRAKRTDPEQLGRWITGSYVAYRNWRSETVHLIYARNGNPNDVDPDTIGQFTGLIDKNGVKIFDGDIVRMQDGDSRLIEWNECESGWNAGSSGMQTAEIIGNVFDCSDHKSKIL